MDLDERPGTRLLFTNRQRGLFYSHTPLLEVSQSIEHTLSMEGKEATPGAPGLRGDAGGGENNPLFLKLPPELRTTIYRYVVVNSTPIQLYLGDVDRRRSKSEYGKAGRRPLLINLKPHPYPLALTCGTFYSEVRPIYVAENTFCMSNASTMEKLHADYITQFRKMMGPFAKKIKKVNIDYRFCTKVEVQSYEQIKQLWVKMSVSLYVKAFKNMSNPDMVTNLEMNSNDSGSLKVETREGCYADLCFCGLRHLARNHSARASDTKLLDFLEAMFKVASQHRFEDILKDGFPWECKKCGGRRRFRQSPMLQPRKEESLVVW